jgi:hypothetical protein
MAPTQTESMAHLLNAFNDGKAATTQKGATPSEQLQKDGTRSAESSTATTTSTMGWKGRGRKGGELLGSSKIEEEVDRSK